MGEFDHESSGWSDLWFLLAVIAGCLIAFIFIGLSRIKAILLALGILAALIGYYALGVTMSWLQAVNLILVILIGLRMLFLRSFRLGEEKWYGDNWLG